MFLFVAANLKPLTVTFFPFHHNSSTVLLSTPTLCDLPPSPVLSHTAVPRTEGWRTSSVNNKSACYFVIIRHNIICITVICQFDLCCTVTCLGHSTVTCLRHSTQPSPHCSHTVTNTIYKPTVPHISNTTNSSSSQFPHTVYCEH